MYRLDLVISGKGVFVLRFEGPVPKCFEGPVPTESCTPEVHLLPEIPLSCKLSEKSIKLSLFLGLTLGFLEFLYEAANSQNPVFVVWPKCRLYIL